jgi:hypothetical protein
VTVLTICLEGQIVPSRAPAQERAGRSRIQGWLLLIPRFALTLQRQDIPLEPGRLTLQDSCPNPSRFAFTLQRHDAHR